MSHEEADPSFDLLEKPYDLSKHDKGSGEPQGPADAALGLPEQSPAPSKEELEGEKTVTNYSAKIQEHAEELYATLLARAKQDPSSIDALISSKDPLDRKYAQKLIERNADLFGAKSLDEYKLQQARKAAGDDPVAQKLAETEARISQIDEKQQKAEWDRWKTDNKITGEFEKLVDDLHSQHPDLPQGKLVAMAKGLSGAVPSPGTKQSSSVAMGGTSAPSEEDVFNSPLAPRLLRGKQSETKKFADNYLKGNLL